MLTRLSSAGSPGIWRLTRILPISQAHRRLVLPCHVRQFEFRWRRRRLELCRENGALILEAAHLEWPFELDRDVVPRRPPLSLRIKPDASRDGWRTHFAICYFELNPTAFACSTGLGPVPHSRRSDTQVPPSSFIVWIQFESALIELQTLFPASGVFGVPDRVVTRNAPAGINA
jgi:hypothetical protein